MANALREALVRLKRLDRNGSYFMIAKIDNAVNLFCSDDFNHEIARLREPAVYMYIG